jgi:hypothetical protein
MPLNTLKFIYKLNNFRVTRSNRKTVRAINEDVVRHTEKQKSI